MIADARSEDAVSQARSLRDQQADISTLNREGSRITHRYSWRIKIPSLPDLDLRYQADIRGGRILRDKVDAIPSDTLKQRSRRGMRYEFLKACSVSKVVFLTIFVLIRYLKRSLQKESRTAARFSRLVSCDSAARHRSAERRLCFRDLDSDNDNLPWWLATLVFSLVVLLLSGLAGAAYAATEGDLREVYPNKLTSVDALLLGKLFSGNVARSVVWGVAFGGWLFLASAMVLRAYGGATLPLEMVDTRSPGSCRVRPG